MLILVPSPKEAEGSWAATAEGNAGSREPGAEESLPHADVLRDDALPLPCPDTRRSGKRSQRAQRRDWPWRVGGTFPALRAGWEADGAAGRG